MECENDPILHRAKFFAEHLNKHNIQSATLMILYDLRIPLHYSGFGYLTMVIPEAFWCSNQIVAAEIYDTVGNRCEPKVTYQNMEAAIRDAVKAGWKIKLESKWGQYFPEYIVQRRKAPSNVEFMTAIAYFMRLWQDCYEKEATYATE